MAPSTGESEERVLGIGVDLVAFAEIERLLLRRGSPSFARIFTTAEIADCDAQRDPVRHYAMRFAAKEAVLKAFGTGWSGDIRWIDVEVAASPAGLPSVRLAGELLRRAAAERASCRLTLSADRRRAVALAILLGRGAA